MKTNHALSVLVMVLSSAAAAADTPALDITGLGANGFDYTQGTYSLGWRFTANKDLNITALGFYDDKMDGIVGNHDVGIFDVVTQQLLVSTTVVPTDALTGFFRYHALATPFTLPGGKDYYMAAVTLTDHYALMPNIVVDPAITFIGFAAYGTSGSPQSTTLHYPDGESQGYVGDFGPSMLISNPGAPTPPSAAQGGAAVDLTKTASTGTIGFQQSFCMGYQFKPTQDIKIATLGYYDDNKDGFKESHSVAIYDALTTNAVASTLVTTNDSLRGNFRYHQVPQITLLKDNPYFIMGANTVDNYLSNEALTDLVVNAGITLVGGAFTNSPPTLGAAYPTQTDTMPPFFGPTFEIVATTPITFTTPATASPAAAFAGQSVTFSAAATGGTSALTYAWDFGDGSLAMAGQIVAHTYASAGMYAATVTATDVVNLASNSAVFVTVTPPLAFASGPTAAPSSVIIGQAVGFSAAAKGGVGALTYSWNFGDNSPPATGAAVSYAYTAPGTYTATVTVADTDGENISATVMVNANTALAFTSPPGAAPTPAGVGQIVTFAAATSGGAGTLTYTWNFGDGSPAATGASVTYAYPIAGTYTATVVVTDMDNESITAPVTVTVKAPLVGTGKDSDGDGFSDAFEMAAGSNPLDASSTPPGTVASVAGVGTMTISKTTITLNFAKSGKDSISVLGLITVPKGFTPNGSQTYFIVGGVVVALKLTSKGSAVSGGNTIKVVFDSKKGSTAKFAAVFNKGTFAATLAGAGLTNSTVKAASVMVPLTFIVDDGVYQKTQTLHYTAKKGASGSAK